MTVIRKFYEIHDDIKGTPYAIIDRWDAYVKVDNKIPVCVSCQTLSDAYTRLDCREICDMLHPREAVYSMHTGDMTVNTTQDFYNKMLSRSGKQQLHTIIACYRTGEHSIVKIGKIYAREEEGYACKLIYAETVQEHDETNPHELLDIGLNWKPIENLDKARYKIFRAQEKAI